MYEPDRWVQPKWSGRPQSSRWDKGVWIAALVGILLLLTGIGGCSFERPGISDTWSAWNLITGFGGFGLLFLGSAALLNVGTFALFARRNAISTSAPTATAGGIILLIASLAPAGLGLFSLFLMVAELIRIAS